MTDKWFSYIRAPGKLTLADVCMQIEQKIHTNADNYELPQEFPDWQSCMEDRDATIYKLSAAVVNLCQMVEYLASEQQQHGAASHAFTVALGGSRYPSVTDYVE